MDVRGLVRDALRTRAGHEPSSETVDETLRTVAAQLSVIAAAGLPPEASNDLAEALAREQWGAVDRFERTRPWASGVTNALIQHVAARRASDLEGAGLPLPSTSITEARNRMDRSVVPRPGTGNALAWLSELETDEPTVAGRIRDRLLVEGGIRLRFLEHQLGVLHRTAPTTLDTHIEDATADVLEAVVAAAGDRQQLHVWGRHLVGLDLDLVEAACAARASQWRAVPAGPAASSSAVLKVLDASRLDDVGLGDLDPAEVAPLLTAYTDELELRVGTALSDGLSDEQLEEFEHVIDAGDDEGADLWLARHVPDFRDRTRVITEEIRVELRQAADVLLAVLGRLPEDRELPS